MAAALEGRSVVVTGASSGIGAETARALARAGASLTIGARREARLRTLAEELAAAGAPIAIQPTDMRQETDIARLFAVARERFGGGAAPLNTAGLGPRAPPSPAPSR